MHHQCRANEQQFLQWRSCVPRPLHLRVADLQCQHATSSDVQVSLQGWNHPSRNSLKCLQLPSTDQNRPAQAMATATLNIWIRLKNDENAEEPNELTAGRTRNQNVCLKCLAIYIVLSKEVVYNCTRPRADLPTGVTAVGQKLPQLENLSPAQRSSANLQQSSGIKHHGTSFERCLLLNVVLSRCYQVCHTRKT